MSEILISKKDMVDLLEKSFEDGYNGYLDMKEDCTNKILNNYLSSKPMVIKDNKSNLTYFDDSIYSTNLQYNSNLYNLPHTTQFTVTAGNVSYENFENLHYNNADAQISSNMQTQFNFQGDLNG